MAPAAVRYTDSLFGIQQHVHSDFGGTAISSISADNLVVPCNHIGCICTHTQTGTHVANLAECQAFAVLSLERNRGAARVVFLAGGRAVARLGAALGREAALGKAFSCAPDELVARTEQALAARRDAVKESKALQAELAEALGAALGTSAAADMLKCASCHRTAPATPPFLGAIFAAAQDVCKDATVLLTASNGPDAKDGMVLLAGPADAVALAAPEVARCVDARGGGKKGRWQGRAAKLTAQAVAEAQEAMRRALASAE